MPSVEEQVEDAFKQVMDTQKIKRYTKNESINSEINNALRTANSKSGNKGRNYPDIQTVIDDRHGRIIPVMIEAKGTQGKLEKVDKDGNLSTATNAVIGFAVNGALHYAQAILDYTNYKEVIAIGINGWGKDTNGNVAHLEARAYYVSSANAYVPKRIEGFDIDFTLLKASNTAILCDKLDQLNLTDEERENAKRNVESALEARIKSIHQRLYDDDQLKIALGTNAKLHLFCGLIMAGLSTQGVSPLQVEDLHGDNSSVKNDGTMILSQIQAFLEAKHADNTKIDMITKLLHEVFANKTLWEPTNGESTLRVLYKQVREEIIPCLESNLHLDFTGRILNSLNDWVSIENDSANDVVLTPHYITQFMARLTQVNRDSYVFDAAMGSGGFLVAAMEQMISDAQAHITDTDALEAKIRDIKENQLLGIEILGNIYILAVLNMILMGDGSSSIVNMDSHQYKGTFIPTVFLLNPPYSATGKGLVFVDEGFQRMTNGGYGAVLIQENAGAGQGQPYASNILKNNTLLASIHMPAGLFNGKASVQTAIYVFQTGRPHEKDDLVKFFDMSVDGYTRQNRKKSTQEVNLRDTDNAKYRYAEVVARVLGKRAHTEYYTKENGLFVEDTITLQGDDWTFAQHRKIDTTPTEGDFKRTVADYLAWKVSMMMKTGE